MTGTKMWRWLRGMIEGKQLLSNALPLELNASVRLIGASKLESQAVSLAKGVVSESNAACVERLYSFLIHN